MSIITIVLSLLVSLEHLYIMFIETIKTTSDTTSRVFNIETSKLNDETVNTLLKNQGVYNGLLAILILVAIFTSNSVWLGLLLGYVVLVAAYGAISSDPMIIVKQAGLAIVALITLLVL